MFEQDITFDVVIPAFQEGDNIFDVVTRALLVCKKLPGFTKIIVVCDGSSDNTARLAKNAGALVVKHPYNKGYGASLKTGILTSSSDVVIFIDADGQHNPEFIPALLNKFKGYDMVVGSRKLSQGSPAWRKPGKFILGLLANSIAAQKIPDLNSGFRLVKREIILKYLPLMPNGFSFSTTSTIALFKAGYNVCYVPIHVARRKHSKSSVTLVDGVRTTMLIIRIFTLFSPLRIFIPVSFFVFIFGFYYIALSYLNIGQSSLKGLIVIFISLLIFMFGIMVDQIASIRRGEVIDKK